MQYLKLNLILTLTAFLVCAGPALTQEEPEHHPFMEPLPERFEEALDIAMHENPEVVMARIQLQQAAAELRQARMETIREITTLWRERAAIHAMLENGAPDHERNELEMELDNMQAHLRYLIGMGVPMEGAEHEDPRLPMMPRPRPALSDAMRQQLQVPVSVSFQGEMDLSEALELLGSVSGVNLIPDFEIPIEEPVRGFETDNMPLEQVMRALSDQMAFLAFVFRDYGVLVTHRERAMQIDAPAIPENLPLFQPEMPGPHPEEAHRE
jgi:hypothetical protein